MPNQMRTKFLALAFVLLCTILTFYAPSLHYGFLRYDDYDLIVQNPAIKGIEFWRLFRFFDRPYITLFSPITMLSYWFDYQVWGPVPFGFRFSNLLLHFSNAVLVFYLVFQIHKALGFAFLVAVIFALHPIQIESVAWIAERKNLLSSFFFLIALICYWKGNCSADLRLHRRRLFQSVVAFALAALSKPNVVVFPLILLLLDYFFFGSRQIRKHFKFYSAVLIFAFFISAVTIWATKTDPTIYQGFLGGSFWTNLWIMMTVFWRYVGLLLFPYQQNILYSSIEYRSLFNPLVLSSALGMVLFFLFSWFCRKKLPQICFWLSWFVILLLPVSNVVVSFPSLMNDRYLYLPMIGFFSAFLFLIKKLSRGFLFSFSQLGSASVSVVCALVLIIPFMVTAVQRIPEWQDTETLWRSALHRTARPYYRIYYLLGSTLIAKGRSQEAIQALKQANALQPEIDSYVALSAAYRQAGDLKRAENFSKSVIKLDPSKVNAYNELGVVYKMTGRFREAEEVFQKALAIEPEHMAILNNYGNLLLELDRTDEGLRILEKVLSLNPDDLNALQNLAVFYGRKGNVEKSNFYQRRFRRLSAYMDPVPAHAIDMIK